MQVDHLASIRVGQAVGVDLATFQDTLSTELAQKDVDTLPDGHLVVGQDDLRLEGWLVRRVDTGEALLRGVGVRG